MGGNGGLITYGALDTKNSCANMTGSEKRPLLVIGKYKSPHCFKHRGKPPVEYDANANAWMNSKIFDAWLKKWNEELAQDDRHILLYVDNSCPHKSTLKLSHIELKLLPANTTARSQPLDQGIIRNIKFHYKRILLNKIVNALDNNQEFQLNLFKALRLLKIAWNKVKQTTIQHCFHHAGFVDNDRGLSEEADEDEQEMEEIIGLWQQLVIRDRTDGTELDEYMDFDGEMELSESEEMEPNEQEEMEPIAVGPSEMTRRKPATILKINRHNK
uniref:DDE-1 domain-containing protein n=1 Tax=Acrobeloides nanus TaxID=290746 RepID=A0A914DVE0_9BILA